MYGIKIKPVGQEPYFLQSLSEYTGMGNSSAMKFNSVDDAELFAQNMELKLPYDIVKV